MGRIYLSPPDVGPLEEQYVLRALRSGWIAPAGPDLEAFEREVAGRIGAGHAVALNSGTSALHLALLALGIGPGDVVAVPTLTFAASANAVVYTGAAPLFVDCDPATGNIDVSLLAANLNRVTAVMPVDLLGTCADYTALLPLCDGIPVVEDAAEALGATHGGSSAGTFGQAAALSFNGNKIMTTSGGGMLISADAELIDRCRYLSTQARQPVHHYEHVEIGYNYRLSNVLAALGRAQLLRLDEMLARRHLLRDRYRKLFAQAEGVRVLADEEPGSNCWLTAIAVEPSESGWRAGELAAHLARLDIETRPLWKPMHLQPVFSRAATALTGAAERLFHTSLTLPSGSALTEPQIDRILTAISVFLERR